MDQHLHAVFERALADEPVPPPGDLVREAMAAGTRLRRRRRLLSGGAAVAAVALIGMGVALYRPASPPPGVEAAGPAPVCSAAAVVLTSDISGKQRQKVANTLAADARVREWTHQNPDAAYDEFGRLWRGATASAGPESFRFTLARPEAYPAVRDGLARLPGVQDVIGTACP